MPHQDGPRGVAPGRYILQDGRPASGTGRPLSLERLETRRPRTTPGSFLNGPASLLLAGLEVALQCCSLLAWSATRLDFLARRVLFARSQGTLLCGKSASPSFAASRGWGRPWRDAGCSGGLHDPVGSRRSPASRGRTCFVCFVESFVLFSVVFICLLYTSPSPRD